MLFPLPNYPIARESPAFQSSPSLLCLICNLSGSVLVKDQIVFLLNG